MKRRKFGSFSEVWVIVDLLLKSGSLWVRR